MTSKENIISTKLQSNIILQLKKYEKLNFIEQYAMYMGTAQLLELSLKNLLIKKFDYTAEVLEKKTLGYTAKELRKNNIRADFIFLLENVVSDRNYIAHDLLADEIISNKLLNGLKSKSGFTKQKRILQKAIFELEQIVVFSVWADKHKKWT